MCKGCVRLVVWWDWCDGRELNFRMTMGDMMVNWTVTEYISGVVYGSVHCYKCIYNMQIDDNIRLVVRYRNLQGRRRFYHHHYHHHIKNDIMPLRCRFWKYCLLCLNCKIEKRWIILCVCDKVQKYGLVKF